jgi:hypothetical protein
MDLTFEWTYQAKGKTVNVKLTQEATSMYREASQQHRKLKALLNRPERLSQTVLQYRAKLAQSARRDKTWDIIPPFDLGPKWFTSR